MKTYEITLNIEMLTTHKVRANSPDEANDIARERAQTLCDALRKTRKNISFGDPTDYIMAQDESDED